MEKLNRHFTWTFVGLRVMLGKWQSNESSLPPHDLSH